MRARTVAVAREAGRRRLRRLVVALGVVSAVAGGIALAYSPVLGARDVTIVGAAHTPPAQVLAVTGLASHPPLLDVSDAKDVAALERLPWVARATVTRSFPSSVRVVIVERHPVAEVAAPGASYALVDSTGRVLEYTETRVPELALVTGVSRVPAPGSSLGPRSDPAVAAAGAVPVSLLGRVASVSVAAGGDVVLDLVGGVRVELGPATALREKMVSLATVLARVPLSGVRTIDVRVPSDPLLTT
ncbi:MAG: FtsQ-type POTRA domain-containing protein [Actinomycetota bacterium]|nr:FtsQ-type POTRA domain-containing protein [Actinomycetota bacterium]